MWYSQKDDIVQAEYLLPTTLMNNNRALGRNLMRAYVLGAHGVHSNTSMLILKQSQSSKVSGIWAFF